MDHAIEISCNSAPGEDGICYKMLKHLPIISTLFLLSLFNFIWKNNVFPSLWKTAIVIPIPKKNENLNDVKNYRPIALTSCVCKLMEKMVNTRLVWYLEYNNIFHENQYGFRNGHSSVDVLVRIDTYIKNAFAMKEHVIAVFFDLEKAYDTTWRHHILKTLFNLGIVGELPRFIKNFLSDRKMKIRIDNALSNSYTQHEGVPQGSVLSCSLFALAINELPNCLPQFVECSLFVDDFAIFTRSANFAAAERRIQIAINNAAQWTMLHGFTFSPRKKTASMHFTKKRGVFPNPELSMRGNPIRFTREMKFLGLTLDPKLSYIPHLKILKGRCLKALDLIKCLSRKTWGADRSTLLKIYRALIRSKLDYACQIYNSASTTAIKMLDSIHHYGIRLSTGAFRTSPIPSLYAESSEPSLYLRRDKLCLQLYSRLLGMPNTPTYVSITDTEFDHYFNNNMRLHTTFGYRVRKLLTSLNIQNLSIARSFSYLIFPHMKNINPLCPGIVNITKADTPIPNIRAAFLDHAANHDAIDIYTDGSKGQYGVGLAVILPGEVIKKKLPDMMSIYSSELLAILTALRKLFDKPEHSFTVYSDSRSALQTITNPYSKHPIIEEIHRTLNQLLSISKHVTFCWVPSHCEIPKNEIADFAAKEACKLNNTLQKPLPYKDYYPAFREKLLNKWNTAWRNINRNKLRHVKDNTKLWTTSSRQIRHQEVVLTRLRIGHTRITHNHLLNGSPPRYCEECLVPLSVKHILCECQEYAEERRAAFGSDGLNPTLDLSELLKDDEISVSNVFTFLISINLLDDI